MPPRMHIYPDFYTVDTEVSFQGRLAMVHVCNPSSWKVGAGEAFEARFHYIVSLKLACTA